MASKPSQGIPVEWETHGAIFNAVESNTGGLLSVAYTDGVDTRWHDQICLGPLVNLVDCGAAGGTPANVNGFALSGTMNGTLYLFAIRGTKWAKIQVSNMTLISDDSEVALSEAATDIIYTKSANGTQMISVGMNATAFHNITAVGTTGNDTDSANDGNVIIRVFVHGGGTGTEPTVYGAVGQSVKMIVLAGTTTMETSAWEDIATIADNITPTALAFDGNVLMIGTNEGPYYLQEDFRKFKSLIPEIGADAFNCRPMKQYTFGGIIVPLSTGTRLVKNVVSGRTIGPETYPQNDTPVAGRMSAFTATLRWAYAAIYNPIDDITYLCAMRPTQPEEDWHGKPFSYYSLAKLGAGIQCDELEFIDTAGGVRTNPTIVGGYDDDVMYLTLGRVEREIDDSNYRFASTGTWYGTELRRQPTFVKRIREVVFETADCSSTQTVQIQWSVDGATAVDFGAAISDNGFHRIAPAESQCPRGMRLQPRIVLTTGSSSASPKVIGSLHVKYDLLPLFINGKAFEEVPA